MWFLKHFHQIWMTRLWPGSFDSLHRGVSRDLDRSKVRSNKLNPRRFQCSMSCISSYTTSHCEIWLDQRCCLSHLSHFIGVVPSRLRPFLQLRILLTPIFYLNINRFVICCLLDYSLRAGINLKGLHRLLIFNIYQPITKNKSKIMELTYLFHHFITLVYLCDVLLC